MEAATELFQYNRGNFMFDRKLRQEREYMEQDMRIKQFLLYREDVRDLTDLTVSKMDTYLMIALLEIGCCLDLLVEGVIRGPGAEEHHDQPPEWILWMYVISLAEAMLYLFLSSWFAIHASVSCHSYSVRLLTQFVRLPVPNKAQLDAAAANASQFEQMGPSAFVRVPVVREVVEREAGEYEERVRQQAPPEDAVEHRHSAAGLIHVSGHHSAVTEREHIKVYRELQANWQAHDAYARACLCIGTYAFIHAVGYYTVGLLVVELQAPWAGLATTMVFPALCWLLLRLDLYFENYGQVVRGAVLVSGPLLAMVGATLQVVDEHRNTIIEHAHFLVSAFIFLQHILLIVYIMLAASAREPVAGVRLPTRFRAVLYLDVFGWLDPEPRTEQQGEDQDPPTTRSWLQRRRGSGAGGQARAQIRKQGLAQAYRELVMTRCELEAWRSYGDLHKMPELEFSVADLTRQANDVASSLEAADTDRAAQREANQSVPENPPVWLRIVYHNNTNDHQVEYYHRPSTGDSQLRMPEDSEWISDIDTLKELLASMRERIFAWRAEPEHTNPTATSAPASRRQGRWAHWGQTAGNVDADEDRGTQETRFGGAEAIPAARSNLDREFFHPRRDGGGRQSNRNTGDIPWSTFLAGSVILIVVWALGIGYNVVVPIYYVASGRSQNASFGEAWSLRMAAVPSLTDGERIIAAGDWPRRAPAPRVVGLACHPAFHDTVLLAERYSVHATQLPGGRPLANGTSSGVAAAVADAVQACLARRPDFHGAGIAGVTLECTGHGGCTAVLLGSPGTYALRCPLEGESDTAAGEPELVHLSVAGDRPRAAGPWRSLAAADATRWWALPPPAAAPGRGAAAWAEAELPEPVALRVRRSAAGKVAAPRRASGPRLAVAATAAFRHTAAVADAEAVLSGLTPPPAAAFGSLGGTDGEDRLLLDVAVQRRLLRAWRPPTSAETETGIALEPAPVGAWQLPEGQAWVSACGGAGGLLLATAGGELWRFGDSAEAASTSPPSVAVM